MSLLDLSDAERLKILSKSLVDTIKQSKKACEARGGLDAGSTRAKITTANAKWMRAAEARDLLITDIMELVNGN